MSPPRNAAVRRFSLLVNASLLWKVAALGIFLYFVLRLSGGSL